MCCRPCKISSMVASRLKRTVLGMPNAAAYSRELSVAQAQGA